jgi:hypothetical protein
MVNNINKKSQANALLHIEIEWKLIYIGSAKDEKYDQVLDTFTMGPLEPGVMQFTLEVEILFILYGPLL